MAKDHFDKERPYLVVIDPGHGGQDPGAVNEEVNLDRRLVDKRVFPAIDISRSGTRKEKLLIEELDLNRIWILRKVLSQMNEVEAVELLIDKLSKTKVNQDFLNAMSKGM